MRILILATEPISAPQLAGALPSGTEPGDAEIMVVAPALHKSALRFWLSDADEAIARADRVREESLDQLGDQGMAASADTAEGDPIEAVADALKTFDADRIVLYTRSGDDQRYREDIDDGELQARFGIPVSRAVMPGHSS